ncbi:MAG: hypothetical protein ACRDGJ_03780 [Candidatus Limnocylindria bacterium]
MPDLPRRVASLIVICALGLTVLVPLTARSANPEVAEAHELLDAVDDPSGTANRGVLTGRAAAASVVSQVAAPEVLVPAVAPSEPGSAPMQATLFRLAPMAVAAAPPPIVGDTVTGRATWYCCTLGWRGAAVVALPTALGGAYTPPPASRTATVCADRCVALPVVDACECHWGTTDQKVADLSPEAWAAVTDTAPSRGVIAVTVHLGG